MDGNSNLRGWRDFARECFCFGSEAVRGLVKSRGASSYESGTLARFSGRILWCVHMGNFNPVDRDEFKKHKQNGGT